MRINEFRKGNSMSKKSHLITGLALVGICGLLLPVFGHDPQDLRTRPAIQAKTVLSATASKAPPANLLSARSDSFPPAPARDATNDTFDATALVQDETTAWYLDDLPDNHTFGTGTETAGLNLISGVDMWIAGADNGPGLPDPNLLQVNYWTSDGSDLVPAGAISENSTAFQSWRFDVGTGAAGTDKITWTPDPDYTILESGICLYDNGANMGCFELILHDSDANGLSGVGVVGLGGADIADTVSMN